MHLEMLRVFCDLAQLRSFSKTAEQNLLSQSAVSQQLAQLEVVHKCQLIDRTKRPIELTRAGQSFFQAAKDILERYEQLRTELNALRTSGAGQVSIAAIFSIGMHALPDYVKEFMLKYPHVNVRIEYFSAHKVYGLVLNGEVDIGLVAVPQKDRRLDVYDFKDEVLVLACSPKHPLARESHVDIHKLQFEPFVAFEKDTPTRRWVDGILERYNVVIRPVMEFDNIETIKRALEISAGVSIVPEVSILQEVAGGTIKAIPFTNEKFTRPTGIIVRKGKILSPPARFFIDLLRKKTKEPGPTK